MFRGRELFLSYLRLSTLIRLAIIVFLVICLFGTVIHFVEPDNFPTIFDGIYWALVTASTVGFGDYVPLTNQGRILAMILILIGGGFVTFYMATLSRAAIQAQQSYQEGTGIVNKANHIILVGWNERAKEVIKQVHLIYPNTDLVLIDKTLSSSPFTEKHIHFLKGDPTEDDTLIRANLSEANTILITSDQSKEELDADMHAILTLLAVKGINKRIYSLIEIQTTKQVENAKRAGADEVIETNQMAGYLMTSSLFSHGITTSVQELFNHLERHLLVTEQVPDNLINQTILNASRFLLEKETLLLGIKKGEKIDINPSPSYVIQPNDYMIIIKS